MASLLGRAEAKAACCETIADIKLSFSGRTGGAQFGSVEWDRAFSSS
jgi:hypothetical protein